MVVFKNSYLKITQTCQAQAKQTLALAEPEARHYFHPVTDIRPLLNRYPASAQQISGLCSPQQMFVLAISQPFLNGMS